MDGDLEMRERAERREANVKFVLSTALENFTELARYTIPEIVTLRNVPKLEQIYSSYYNEYVFRSTFSVHI